MESKVVVPAQGKKITLQNGKLNVPENPIIPYIEGDGIGVDVTPAMLKVVDAAVEKAYKGERKISWMMSVGLIAQCNCWAINPTDISRGCSWP